MSGEVFWNCSESVFLQLAAYFTDSFFPPCRMVETNGPFIRTCWPDHPICKCKTSLLLNEESLFWANYTCSSRINRFLTSSSISSRLCAPRSPLCPQAYPASWFRQIASALKFSFASTRHDFLFFFKKRLLLYFPIYFAPCWPWISGWYRV